MAQDPRARFSDNPFFVLGLTPSASRVEVERQGAKLLGMLELGVSSAKSYLTPLGPQLRDADKVRRAMSELRDPAKRAVHEVWASVDAGSAVATEPREKPVFENALAAFGWKR